MNISKSRAKQDFKELAGTHRQVGKDLDELELGGHEGILTKIYMNKLYFNGWFVTLKDTGEQVDAFMTFDLFERTLPDGNITNGVLMLNPPQDVYLTQDRSGDEWHIIRWIDNQNVPISPGEKVFQNGESRVSIKEDLIQIDAPVLKINGKTIEEWIAGLL